MSPHWSYRLRGARRPVKIVALVSFRNEAPYIDTFMTSICDVVDEVVAIDDFSSDDTAARMRAYEGRVAIHLFEGDPDRRRYPVEKARARLLSLGRELAGTHFVCLDADEAFTAPFAREGRQLIADLRPGEKLVMQWLAMWKSTSAYRDDESVWSANFKDFVVCDTPRIGAHDGTIHTGRTPGPNTDRNQRRLPVDRGAVMHFQFADWERFQWKQAWYRCFERVFLNKSAPEINDTYRITLDDPDAVVRSLEPHWVLSRMPVLDEAARSGLWFRDEILTLFEEFGLEPFLELDIWHIPDLIAWRRAAGPTTV